jgi:hypothetical protein
MQREQVNKLLQKAVNPRQRSRSRERNIQYKFSPQVAEQFLNPVSYGPISHNPVFYAPHHVSHDPILEQYDVATQEFLRLSKIELDILNVEIEILKKKIQIANLAESQKKNQQNIIYYQNFL